GEHCSMTNRRADEATRDVSDWLKCEFMQDHVGEVHDGVISGVTGFGVFVELSDIYIEGLVHITALKNDYYQFDAAGHRLLGERTRKVYRLGDKVLVKVVRVNLDDKKIDLEIV
ncbi:MAG TPA: S1 RNA-binding domain-containing protein, partial [Methylophaga sp.]|nr:S1 RNA-binding domain-containing protein [Methylophaga sp.]